jgi:hypothetical protein
MFPEKVTLGVAVPKVKELLPKVTIVPEAPVKSPIVKVPEAELKFKVLPELLSVTFVDVGRAEVAATLNTPALMRVPPV